MYQQVKKATSCLMDEAIKDKDIVVTATGNKDIVADHMRNMKDRAIYNIDILIMKYKLKL